MGLLYMPISWGGFGGQLIGIYDIWQSHGVSGLLSEAIRFSDSRDAAWLLR